MNIMIRIYIYIYVYSYDYRCVCTIIYSICSLVDGAWHMYFRRIAGHTQVNAADENGEG